MAGLKVPDDVAMIAYPKGVRIRRVRVRAAPKPAARLKGSNKPLIISRQELRDSRTPREE
jgi:hypothetical protein